MIQLKQAVNNYTHKTQTHTLIYCERKRGGAHRLGRTDGEETEAVAAAHLPSERDLPRNPNPKKKPRVPASSSQEAAGFVCKQNKQQKTLKLARKQWLTDRILLKSMSRRRRRRGQQGGGDHSTARVRNLPPRRSQGSAEMRRAFIRFRFRTSSGKLSE